MLDMMSDHLVQGETVKLSSFGTFMVRAKNGRVGPNQGNLCSLRPDRLIGDVHFGRQFVMGEAGFEFGVPRVPAKVDRVQLAEQVKNLINEATAAKLDADHRTLKALVERRG